MYIPLKTDQIQCSTLLLVHVCYIQHHYFACEWAGNVTEPNTAAISQVSHFVTLFKKSYNHILLLHCYQNTWTHKVFFQFHKKHQSRHTTETDERSTFHSCLLRNALMVFLFCLLQTFYKCFLILGGKVVSQPVSQKVIDLEQSDRHFDTSLFFFTWKIILSH